MTEPKEKISYSLYGKYTYRSISGNLELCAPWGKKRNQSYWNKPHGLYRKKIHDKKRGTSACYKQ